MKILVIESSPHKHGSSNLLAGAFIRGAQEAGHTIAVFDAGPLCAKGRYGAFKRTAADL